MTDTVVTAIAAQKGGTGKTALAGSLGPLWAYAGHRTLLIDLDQQANLTYAFAVNPAELDATVVDVLAPQNAVPAERAILRNVHQVGGLDLLPCDERAEALDTQLRSETMGVYKLADALESLRGNYDRIFMDCPPNIGELTVSALLAADEIICPVNMGDINAVRGLSRLTQTVEKLNRRDAGVRFKSLVKVNCDDRESRYRLSSDALSRLAHRLDALGCGVRASHPRRVGHSDHPGSASHPPRRERPGHARGTSRYPPPRARTVARGRLHLSERD